MAVSTETIIVIAAVRANEVGVVIVTEQGNSKRSRSRNRKEQH